MGRRGMGRWLHGGLAIAHDLDRSFVYERDDLIVDWAARLGVTKNLAGRWAEQAFYVRHWADANGVNAADTRASLSTVEVLRALEVLDWPLARSLQSDVMSGAITEHRLRAHISAAVAGRRAVPDKIRSVVRDALIDAAVSICSVDSPESIAAAAPRAGYDPLSWIAAKCGVDAEVADRRMSDPRIAGCVAQFALVVSPEISCAVNVGRSPESVFDVVWKAARVYRETVYAAASFDEVNALERLKSEAYGGLANVHILLPIMSMSTPSTVTWQQVESRSGATVSAEP